MVFLYTYFIKGYTKCYIFRDNIELICLFLPGLHHGQPPSIYGRALVIPRNIIQYKEIVFKKFNVNFANQYKLLYQLQVNGIHGHKIMWCFLFLKTRVKSKARYEND